MSTTQVIKGTRGQNVTYTVGEFRLTIMPRGWDERNAVTKKTRLHGAVDTLGGELGELLNLNTYVPVSSSGHDNFTSAEERAQHQREYNILKRRTLDVVRAQLRALLPLLAPVLDVDPDDLTRKLSYSIHAGCGMCPCSPGFILDTQVRVDGQPVDLWLDRTVPESNPLTVIDPTDR